MSEKFLSIRNPHASLIAPSDKLGSCVCMYIVRDTLGTSSSGINHYPATPLCSVVWSLAGATAMAGSAGNPHAQKFEPGTAVFNGPQPQPWSTSSLGPAHFIIALFYPDAVHALTGLDMSAWVGKSVPASSLLGMPWQTLTAALIECTNDADRAALINIFLEERWEKVSDIADRPHGLLADWIGPLSGLALSSSVAGSKRTTERRIKAAAGLSLRTMKRMSRAEQALMTARAELDAGKISWSDVAADTGYADQSHMTRDTRALTGLSPGALAHMVEHDDSYWLYNIWSHPIQSS
jgi:AraC-like DNA-binding protein